MMYLEYADDFIEMIRHSLPEDHPLSKRDFFPEAKISKEYVFIIKDDTSGKAGMLDFRQKMRRKGKRMPYYKELLNESEVQALIDKDHEEWLASLPRDDER